MINTLNKYFKKNTNNTDKIAKVYKDKKVEKEVKETIAKHFNIETNVICNRVTLDLLTVLNIAKKSKMKYYKTNRKPVPLNRIKILNKNELPPYQRYNLDEKAQVRVYTKCGKYNVDAYAYHTYHEPEDLKISDMLGFDTTLNSNAFKYLKDDLTPKEDSPYSKCTPEYFKSFVKNYGEDWERFYPIPNKVIDKIEKEKDIKFLSTPRGPLKHDKIYSVSFKEFKIDEFTFLINTTGTLFGIEFEDKAYVQTYSDQMLYSSYNPDKEITTDLDIKFRCKFTEFMDIEIKRDGMYDLKDDIRKKGGIVKVLKKLGYKTFSKHNW